MIAIQLPNGKTVQIDTDDPKAAAAAGRRIWAQERPRSTGEDVGTGLLTGIGKGVTGLLQAGGEAASNVLGISPLTNALELGAIGAGLLSGKSPAEAGLTRGGLLNTRRSSPVAGLISRVDQAAGLNYQPQTRAGKYAKAIGANAPAALVPGGAATRVANVILPAVTSEAAGQGAEALGASEDVADVARVAGGIAGGLGASVRAGRKPPTSAIPRQDLGRVRQRLQDYRAAGIEPTAVDLVDDSGRGVIRAAASRMTPGRQTATDYADDVALALPDRIGVQARRIVSDDRRTPQQVIDELVDTQAATARTNYAGPYAEQVNLTDDVIDALGGTDGQAAVQRALRGAEARRDNDLADELRQLQTALRDPANPVSTLSGAALDRIQIAMRERGQSMVQRNARDNASGLEGRRADINAALDQAPGLSEARGAFRDQQRNIEAAEAADGFLRPGSADAFAATVGQASDLAPARAVAARAIEQAAGENPSAAPGVARRLANAPEQQARNAALLGQDDALRLQDAMRLEAMRVRNAQDIAPRFGSQTQNKLADAAQLGRSVMRQDWVGIGIDWLRSHGMNDAQAQRLIEAALDPARVDEVVEALGPAQADRLLRLTRAGTAGLLAAQQTQQQ